MQGCSKATWGHTLSRPVKLNMPTCDRMKDQSRSPFSRVRCPLRSWRTCCTRHIRSVEPTLAELAALVQCTALWHHATQQSHSTRLLTSCCMCHSQAPVNLLIHLPSNFGPFLDYSSTCLALGYGFPKVRHLGRECWVAEGAGTP